MFLFISGLFNHEWAFGSGGWFFIYFQTMEVIKCNPIDTLEELNSWKPPTSTAVLQHAHEDVRIGAQQPGHSFKRLRKSDAPKTLICHDMKGNSLQQF